MRAFVVDDSRAIRMILARLLKDAGFAEVHEASNGREGLALLRKLGTPDLVLVDWNMPEMDGLTLVRTIRNEAQYSNVCMVMVTTETEKEQMVRALAAGANDYVMKPFTREGMLEKLALLGFSASEG